MPCSRPSCHLFRTFPNLGSCWCLCLAATLLTGFRGKNAGLNQLPLRLSTPSIYTLLSAHVLTEPVESSMQQKPRMQTRGTAVVNLFLMHQKATLGYGKLQCTKGGPAIEATRWKIQWHGHNTTQCRVNGGDFPHGEKLPQALPKGLFSFDAR